MNYNRFEGPIPEELWTLSELKELDLNDNRLEGELSGSISNLIYLRFLQLHSNRFAGEIPIALGDLQLLGASVWHACMHASIVVSFRLVSFGFFRGGVQGVISNLYSYSLSLPCVCAGGGVLILFFRSSLILPPVSPRNCPN